MSTVSSRKGTSNKVVAVMATSFRLGVAGGLSNGSNGFNPWLAVATRPGASGDSTRSYVARQSTSAVARGTSDSGITYVVPSGSSYAVPATTSGTSGKGPLLLQVFGARSL